MFRLDADDRPDRHWGVDGPAAESAVQERRILTRLRSDFLMPDPRKRMVSQGAVAQLGERLHGMQEVEGSTPFGSIFRKIHRLQELRRPAGGWQRDPKRKTPTKTQFRTRIPSYRRRKGYGHVPANALGPKSLRLLREEMIRGDANATPRRKPWSRTCINLQVQRIHHVFKETAARELLPAPCDSRVPGGDGAGYETPRM